MSVPAGADRLLIVNADDFGLTPGVCRAILAASERGIVTSTTALAVAPAFDAWAADLRDSGLAVGAHLCAVGEDPPLLTAAEVPTLVDSSGRFPLTWRQFLARAARGGIDSDDLRREFSAQIDLLQGAGLTLTHVDAHQNLHLWPTVARVALDLARERQIGAVRVTRSSKWGPTAAGVRVLSAALQRRARSAGMVFPAASTGLDEAGHLELGRLVAAVERLGRSGARTAEIAVHPGEPDDPDRSRYRWGYQWADELSALCAPQVSGAVAGAGFRLGSFAELPTAEGVR